MSINDDLAVQYKEAGLSLAQADLAVLIEQAQAMATQSYTIDSFIAVFEGLSAQLGNPTTKSQMDGCAYAFRAVLNQFYSLVKSVQESATPVQP